MKNRLIIFVFSLFLLTDFSLYSQSFFSENFDNPDSWKINSSEGVEVTSKSDVGVSGKCISFDVNFTLGSGYGGVYELVDVELPQNYQLTFWVKAKDIPSNNFEIKLVDPSGDNVWWMNKKGFDFPGEWTKITLHKRNLNFAWGPQGGGEITKIGRIEFIVASVNGGKGTIYLDDLKIEKLDPPSVPTSDPVVSFSDNKLTIAENQLFDNNPQTFWSGGEGINHFELNIDFTVQKEFGGIVTDWANNGFPAKYIFEGSNDKNNWTKLSESKGKSGKSYIVTPEARSPSQRRSP